MKRQTLFLLLILFCLSGFAKNQYEQLWKRANYFYQQKEFDSAAVYYEQIAAAKPAQADVYYNLGNAYYKLNQIGLAVLNYERSLRMDPDNKAAADNLELAQSRIANRIQNSQDIFFVRWWKKIAHPQHATIWAVISLIFFLLILLLFFLKKWSAPSWYRPQYVLLLSLLFLGSAFMAFVSSSQKTKHDRAVVMTPDAPFHSSIKESKSQSLVPEGTVVEYGREQSGWVEVYLPDGRKGWIEKSMLSKI